MSTAGAASQGATGSRSASELGGAPVLVAGADDPVAAFGLGPVERGVGERDQLGPVIGVLRVHGPADRRRQQASLDRLDAEVLHGRASAFEQVADAVLVACLEDQGELLAADAEDAIGCAQRAADRLTGAAQHGVALGMSEVIVDELEAVEIDDGEREAETAAARQRDPSAQLGLEGAAIGQAGERVVAGGALQLLL